MSTYSLTRSRTIQYIGILLALVAIAAGYWYFAVRAGVKTNTSAGQSLGDGGLAVGLVGYWTLDEGTGTSAADSSVNATTALTLTNGPTWTTGQVRSAIDFDGTDDYATTADTATLDFGDTDDITITGWFNRTTSFNTVDTVVAKRNSNTAADIGYIINIDNTTDLIALEVSDGTDEYSVTSATSFTSAGWHHFAFVWDQDSATNVEVYIDGRDDNGTKTGTIGNIGDISNAVAFRLGAESDNGNPFDGLIDEVRVYDRALSLAEIADIYKLTVPTSVDTGLKGYWSFGSDDIRGTLVSDRSGARNTGTLVNTPTKTIGKIGQAFNFTSASSQYINAGSGAAIDDIVNLSACAWVKPNSSLTTYGDVVTKYTNAGVGWQMLLDYATLSNLGLSFYRVFSTSAGHWFATTVLPYNQWSHVCVTYNNSSVANDPVFYVNGMLVATYENAAPVGTASAEGTGDLYIGAYNNAGSPGELFDGIIDEPRVYNRIITAAEVKALYDAGSANKANTSAGQPEGVGNPDSGLVGYWKLDEGTGTSAADASVNATAAGTLTNGPTWGTGRIGGAVTFDGTNDYIALSDPANGVLDFGDTDDMTIAGWFNRSTFTTTDVIIGKWDGVNPGYRVYIDDANDALHFQLFDGTDTYAIDANGFGITAAGWHHFVAVWDQDSPANSEIYVDGLTLNATDSGTIGNIGTLANSVALSIGETPGSGISFAGSLDEIRIYDRAFSPEEVNTLYNQTAATGVDTSLRGYWSFNATDTPGTTAYDRSGRRNTGTLTGSPTKVIGRVGQGMTFGNQVAKYVEIGQGNGLSDLSQKTACAWINPISYGSSASDASFLDRDDNNNGGGGWLFQLADDDTGIQSLYFVTQFSGVAGQWHAPAGVITLNSWQHVCVTYDNTSASNDPVFYVNGVSVPVTEHVTPVGTVSAEHASLTVLRIGDMRTDTASSFDGAVDEVRLYSRILSASEIKGLYDLGAPNKSNTSASTPQGTGNLDSGLAAYWKLDENTGTSAGDTSANALTGTLTNGPTWTTGRIGSAVQFDGTNDRIEVGDQSTLEGYDQISVSAWANPSVISGAEETIVSKELIFKLDISATAGNVARFMTGNSWSGLHSTTVLSTGTWYHIVGTYDGVTKKIYINGALEASTALTGNITTNTRSVQIGSYDSSGTPTAFLTGAIDEVRVYNRALSAEEVANLYRLTAPTGTDTGLVGYWSMNGQDTTATTAYDRSGAANSGTLTNGPTKVIGKLGQALNFDGTDDYVNAGSATIIDNLTNLSICAWVNPDTLPNGYSAIIGQMDNGGAEATFGFHDNGTADYIEFYRTFSGTIGEWHSDGNIVPTGSWSHICMTYNNSSVANDPAYYLNGAQIGVVEVSTPVGTASSTAGGDYFIGAIDNGVAGTDFLDGKIDEVRLYNRILTAAEIQSLYNSGR